MCTGRHEQTPGDPQVLPRVQTGPQVLGLLKTLAFSILEKEAPEEQIWTPGKFASMDKAE